MQPILSAGALPFGLGTMRVAGDEALAILHRALDGGIRLLDTADVYGPDPIDVGSHERLVARALRSWGGPREEVVVATKGGLVRRGKEWIPDGRAKHIRAACESSLRALGVDSIDLYQLHARDPKVPFLTTLRALSALAREGKVRSIGLSNVGLEELEQARDHLELASVQVALGPLDLTPLKSGLAEYAVRRGIALLAHSPLGGPRGRGLLGKETVLREVAERHDATVPEVALAWIRRLHPLVIPVAGASRTGSVDSILRAARLDLRESDLEELSEAYRASRRLRTPRPGPGSEDPLPDGEVVLFVGYPGAGKSTLAKSWIDRGYRRLNRDLRGGSLRALLPELERSLARGDRRIVLDNTYPRRDARWDVLDLASRHGAAVRCVWLRTSLEQAQVNAVERMVRRYGRLLSPEEIKRVSARDPNAFPPEAQFRYRQQLEAPRPEEGFREIEVVDFVRAPAPERTGRALFFDYDSVLRRTRSGAPRPRDPEDVEILPGRRPVLARYAELGYRLLGVSYQPEIPEEIVRACFARTHQLLDLSIEAHFCPHPPGPARCWCRKPLPGLGVLLCERYELDPRRCLAIVASAADQGFASRLSIPTISVEEAFA